MKKFSILHAASLGTAFALVFGAVYLTSTPKAEAGAVYLNMIEGGGGGGSTYTGGNTHCQYKKSCSNTQVYVSTNNGCRAPNSENECQTLSGYGSNYHYINGSCQTCGSKVWYNGACRQTCHYSANCSSGTCHDR